MPGFEEKYEEWMRANVSSETNPRRRERLEKGLSHGSVEFLRSIWFPAAGSFDHLHPEWEVRDLNGGYRYIDLAYRPGGAMGGIEIQDYGSHARDLDTRRFKDLCWRHGLLALDGWTLLPIAYPSIKEEPQRCKQLVLAFIGKFVATDVPVALDWLEAETVHYARRLLRPFSPSELAGHLRITANHARRLLNRLVEMGILSVASGNQRHRTFVLPSDDSGVNGKKLSTRR
ncbi:transcriptional regulator [Cohnella xylanilytica]|uniref:Transcriptional regulator n=1 Tax=Cohnella xylanilytica TaxID=557555 RepID=A0A841TZ56_9BACL|nr:transcriptional regulator [Cohnella xylanilytica]MBB6692248.1 transcriptional regulator [Cohnella xylanilytica]